MDNPRLVLWAKVHSAAVPIVLEGVQEEFPWLGYVCVDQGYTGSGRAGIETQLGWYVDVLGHPPKPSRVWAPIGGVITWETLVIEGTRGVLPRRRGIEHMYSWCGQSCRLSQGGELLCATSGVLIYALIILLILRRLAHA